MSSVLKKGVTVWLLALTLSPFTAPFSTCDLAALLAGSAGHEPSSPASVTTPRTDATLSQVFGVRRDVGRVKLIALFCTATSPYLTNRSAAALRRPGVSGVGSSSRPLQEVLRI